MHMNQRTVTRTWVIMDSGNGSDSVKLAGSRSLSDNKVEWPIKDMGGPIKLPYVCDHVWNSKKLSKIHFLSGKFTLFDVLSPKSLWLWDVIW